MNEKKDIYGRVTDKIVAALEQGLRPWQKPWGAGHAQGRIVRPQRHNGELYRGINVLTLWAEAADKGYASPIWMTFRQAQELGGQVRKGEKGSPVVYANALQRTETDEQTDEANERTIPYLKGYTVFNAEQIEGLSEQYYPSVAARLTELQRSEDAERFFRATGADIRHGGNRAYYALSSDHIQLPVLQSFRDIESYYATLAHEATHWTMHKTRLDRDLDRKKWGDAGYAMEELVAELGAAFLCADLDLTPEPREDHAAYIAHWLEVLKSDSRAIFAAAAHAQRAADFLKACPARAASEAA
jgi:antirestriction protein ArdC